MSRKHFVSTIPSSEITSEAVYLSRRKLLKLGALGLGGATLAACGTNNTPAALPTAAQPAAPAAMPDKAMPAATSAPAAAAPAKALPIKGAGATTDELGDKLTGFDDITHYNNYYEFDTDKEAVADLAANFKTSPWTITVGGLVGKPKTYDLDDLKKRFGEEERVYRLRCVEAWSMVIPWSGFMLSQLLKEVEPDSKAKFVRFTSLLDPKQMPGQNTPFYEWPYVEGLRLDEAMHDLTLLATGLYGKPLPNQSGAPVRLAVPWKYGFKSIKAIVKIDLVEEMPTSLWMAAGPGEYGFYSNVNPNKAHPRWSQSTERRIGDDARRRSLMYNGYEAQVAGLYAGLDLNANY